MDSEPPLDYLLDAPGGPTPGREELQQIVARSHWRRNRLAAVGMVVTLAVGAAGGWLVRANRSSGGTALAAGAGADTSTTVALPYRSAASAGGYATILGGNGSYTYTKLFVRTTADGVAVRAYEPPPPPVYTPPPGCPSVAPPMSPRLITDISTADVAGQAAGFTELGTAPFKSNGLSVVGSPERAPVWAVTTEVDATVAQVRVTFPDGKTDQMAPVKGWAALAHVVPPAMVASIPATGSVQALDGSGKVIATTTIPSPADLRPPNGVPVPAPAPAFTVPASGVGVAGGGVSSSSGVASATAKATAPAAPVLVPTTTAGSSTRTTAVITSPGQLCPAIFTVPPLPPPTTTTIKGPG